MLVGQGDPDIVNSFALRVERAGVEIRCTAATKTKTKNQVLIVFF